MRRKENRFSVSVHNRFLFQLLAAAEFCRFCGGSVSLLGWTADGFCATIKPYSPRLAARTAFRYELKHKFT